jgi:ABC-type nitrate/sulfonate/bicarbonate transport system ATPase subunit
MTPPLLQIKGLYKAYGQHLVLRDINLDLSRHEVVCLIGASGCGKSTLLRCINLLEEVNAGGMLLEGMPISSDLPNANRIRQSTSFRTCQSSTTLRSRREKSSGSRKVSRSVTGWNCWTDSVWRAARMSFQTGSRAASSSASPSSAPWR